MPGVRGVAFGFLSSAFDTSHLVRSCQIFVCALDGHFGFVIYGHVKRSRSWSRELLSLSFDPHWNPRLCSVPVPFYGHQNFGESFCIWHAVGRCGPKSIRFNFFFCSLLLLFLCFSLFIFQFSFFGFSKFFFGFFYIFFFWLFFDFIFFRFAIGKRIEIVWGAPKLNLKRPQKQIWIFANQAANLRGNGEGGEGQEGTATKATRSA